MDKSKQYQLITYMRIEPEKQERMTLNKAHELREHLEAMQPENIYKVEHVLEG